MSLQTSDNLLICTNCGTQYAESCPSTIPLSETYIPATNPNLPLKSCRTCDDPRQFVLPSGQVFSTFERLRASGKYRNRIERHPIESNVWEIETVEKLGIGQRAALIQTPHGNILWDLVAYLDQDTVDKINELGGLKFIIISHPHFYTTWADWSATFSCPVYLSHADGSTWARRTTSLPPNATLKLLTSQHTELLPGITAVIAGGHFTGSMFLHTSPPNTQHASLFAADTIMNVPSGKNPDPAKPGVNSYAFMWSIPNMIPLDPDTILNIWRAIEPYEFVATYHVMREGEVREQEGHRMTLKQRVLESMKIHCRHAGYDKHEILEL